MSLNYRVTPLVRRDRIDSYTVVFIRENLMDYLLHDFGIAIPGSRFDIVKGEFQAFRVHLCLVCEEFVPISQLLCIDSFTLKVEKYCRTLGLAIVVDKEVLLAVWARESSIFCSNFLDSKFASRSLNKESRPASTPIITREFISSHVRPMKPITNNFSPLCESDDDDAFVNPPPPNSSRKTYSAPKCNDLGNLAPLKSGTFLASLFALLFIIMRHIVYCLLALCNNLNSFVISGSYVRQWK